MPWVRSSGHNNRPFWIIGIFAGVALGGLIGYETWGSTAAIVTIVEKEMASLRAQIGNMEKRLSEIEARFGSASGTSVSEPDVRAAAAERTAVLSSAAPPKAAKENSKSRQK